jgi:hypothetical protein
MSLLSSLSSTAAAAAAVSCCPGGSTSVTRTVQADGSVFERCMTPQVCASGWIDTGSVCSRPCPSGFSPLEWKMPPMADGTDGRTVAVCMQTSTQGNFTAMMPEQTPKTETESMCATSAPEPRRVVYVNPYHGLYQPLRGRRSIQYGVPPRYRGGPGHRSPGPGHRSPGPRYRSPGPGHRRRWRQDDTTSQ